MALDGIFLSFLCAELRSFEGTRIEKIHQPSRDELVLLLRSKEKNGKLLISAKSGFSRLQLIKETPDNPADPPTFCKLLRKYISGAKIVSFIQKGLDRTVFINLSCYNEMGDAITPYLVIELFSNRSNIILCDQNGRIIDAIHRSDPESGGRMLLPGALYEPLAAPDKANLSDQTAEELALAVIKSGRPLSSAFTAAIDGVSPLVSRELAELCRLDADTPPANHQLSVIAKVLKDFKNIISSAHSPTLISVEGEPKDFTYMPITQYSSSAAITTLCSYNTLLEEFYTERERVSRLRAAANDLSRLLSNLTARIERRLSLRLADLEQSRNREELRIFGELLKANLYAIPKGAEEIEVQNYYDENLSSVKIPLNPALSPAANAAKYFKDYKKRHSAEQTLSVLCEKDKTELIYLESVADALQRAENSADIAEIREELAESGYIFSRTARKKVNKSPVFKEYTDKNGFRILVGRNNRENDLLTLKTASKEDIWLHTKDIAGSHVIIFTDKREVPNDTLIFAAVLAAKNSKAATSSNVPVEYTLVKNVKKPSGAKPGMVIYKENRTLYVNPSE